MAECFFSLLVLEDEVETSSGSMMKHMMEEYLNRLPQCINRDLIDKAAMDFCMNINTKGNRRKLTRALFLVPRTRYSTFIFVQHLSVQAILLYTHMISCAQLLYSHKIVAHTNPCIHTYAATGVYDAILQYSLTEIG